MTFEKTELLEVEIKPAVLSCAPRGDWRDMAKSEHFVQFYEDDLYLVESVGQFIGAALGSGGGAVVIATPSHRNAIHERMLQHGLDVGSLIERKLYIPLDAADTLSRFMISGSPDPALFKGTIGPILTNFEKDGLAVSCFGEMVALLWADGNGAAAIHLEELWNELAVSHNFSLFCAYPIAGFAGQVDGQPFTHICDKHTRVIPAESYAAESQADERLRSITLLQQKSVALAAETKARERLELLLREQQTKFLLATNLVGLATWDLHLETYEVACSEEFRNLMGISSDQSLDYQGLLLLIHPADRRRVSNALHTALANNNDYSVEYRLPNGDGSERWLSVIGRYFRGANGQRLLCVTRDITESKRTVEIPKSVNYPVGVVSH